MDHHCHRRMESCDSIMKHLNIEESFHELHLYEDGKENVTNYGSRCRLGTSASVLANSSPEVRALFRDWKITPPGSQKKYSRKSPFELKDVQGIFRDKPQLSISTIDHYFLSSSVKINRKCLFNSKDECEDSGSRRVLKNAVTFGDGKLLNPTRYDVNETENKNLANASQDTDIERCASLTLQSKYDVDNVISEETAREDILL